MRDAWSDTAGLGRFRLVLTLTAGFLGLGFLTRAALFVLAWGELRGATPAIARAVAAGTIRDLAAGLWLTLPWAIAFGLLSHRRFAGRFGRGWLLAALVLTVGLSLFVAAAEIVFFNEFAGRFNFVAVDYLVFPGEVIANIGQSFPVGWVLAGVVATSLAIVIGCRRPIWANAARPVGPAVRLGWPAGHLALASALALATGADVPHVSEDRSLNEIAGNGYLTFAAALMGEDAPYEGLYSTDRLDREVSHLRHRLTEPELVPGSFGPAPSERDVRPGHPARRLNVVVVLEESFGAEYLRAIDTAAAGLAPEFDRLAAQGTLFTNAWATGNRTIRALEATTASIPPLPGISIVRRPQSVGLETLPAVLRANGYATRFIYGGRALFDGMGPYMLANGVDQVIEQHDFPDSAFTTAWGVADEYIFDRALAECDSLAAGGRTFYTLVLTVSNHRPFTYPAGRIDADPGAHRRAHAVAYADWALGRFMTAARGRPWYGQTLFVLMGDHGPRVYGAAEIPLPSYRVPIVMVGPGLTPGARDGAMVSSMDIPPTVLSQLGIPYRSRFFGVDAFEVPAGMGRAVMTHNSELALLTPGRLAVLGLNQRGRVYSVGRSGALAPAPADSTGRELLLDAIAYFHEADREYRARLLASSANRRP